VYMWTQRTVDLYSYVFLFFCYALDAIDPIHVGANISLVHLHCLSHIHNLCGVSALPARYRSSLLSASNVHVSACSM
jgi:hypothetical protein